MGNSEVGHLNIGAGRIVQMDITRIDAQIASGEFANNPPVAMAMKRAREAGRQLHLFACARTAAFTRSSSTSTPCSAPRASTA